MCVYKFVYTFATILIILQCKNVRGGSKFQQTKKLLHEKGILHKINVPHLDFDTGDQEFGCFKGYFKNLTINGLDTFNITKLDFSSKKLQLNILVPQLTFTGDYDLNGMLNFPMGNKPINVFGNGDMKIVIGNIATSIELTIKSKAGVIKVVNLEISVNITTINAKLCNLMGGGPLEDIFNEYLNVLGTTVFDYYKNDIIEQLKDPLIQEITKFLNSVFSKLKSVVAETILNFIIY